MDFITPKIFIENRGIFWELHFVFRKQMFFDIAFFGVEILPKLTAFMFEKHYRILNCTEIRGWGSSGTTNQLKVMSVRLKPMKLT